MIDYNNNTNVLEMGCESCETKEEFSGNWYECIDQAKENGWRIILENKNWEHYCEECKESLLES